MLMLLLIPCMQEGCTQLDWNVDGLYVKRWFIQINHHEQSTCNKLCVSPPQKHAWPFLNKLVVEYKGATINTCLGNYKVKQRQFISSFSSKVSCFFFVFLHVLCFYQYDTHIQQQRFVFTRHALIHLCLFSAADYNFWWWETMCISDGELTRSRRPIIWCSLCLFYFLVRPYGM